MPAIGIISEYNPFHSGHAWQISQARKLAGKDSAVVVVMSGNWVQQADCAIADKWTRARLALMGGTDLVLELPTLWATASAERFARGGVFLLESSGVVDLLSFGSECGDTALLQRVAACLDSPAYEASIRRFADEGMSFASARQAAVCELLGEELAGLLSRPNNNLGIEYIRALSALNSHIRPTTVLRKGAGHRQSIGFLSPGGMPRDEARRLFWTQNPTLSATSIRTHLMDGDWELMEHYLPEGGGELLRGELIRLPALRQVERAMLARVRTMTPDDWAALPDAGAAEGLPRRLERAGRQCSSMAEFFDLAKTKRYTHARLRRLALWAFLGVRAADFLEYPPYLRVLGFNSRGREVLRRMRDCSSLPILTRPAQARRLDGPARQVFELEARCTDLYGLCFQPVRPGGMEWTHSPVILL